MEKSVLEVLLSRARVAIGAGDWDAVARLWQPWIDQGNAEAQYQLAYHYLWFTSCEDDATTSYMEALVRDAAAKGHPDAIWFVATHLSPLNESSSVFEQALLRAGRLGSANAQRSLGVLYATGNSSGQIDLVEAARWYRLAAEQGHAESQYDLGFMLLLGEGGPKNTGEGLMWLERAGQQKEYAAYRLLAECYGFGYLGVPMDAVKAALWRDRQEGSNGLIRPWASTDATSRPPPPLSILHGRCRLDSE